MRASSGSSTCIAWAILYLAFSPEVSTFCPPPCCGGLRVDEAHRRQKFEHLAPHSTWPCAAATSQIRGDAPVVALRRRNRRGRESPVMSGAVDGGTEGSSTAQVRTRTRYFLILFVCLETVCVIAGRTDERQ